MSSGHTLEADCLDETSRTLHEPRKERESAKSQVLSRTNLSEIAIVRFDELEIGVKLGNGSFSDVQ